MISSQKGTFGLNNNVTFGSSLKLAQLIALCQNQSMYIERYPTFGAVLHSLSFSF